MSVKSRWQEKRVFRSAHIEYKFHFIYSHESVIHQETAGSIGHIFIPLFIYWRNKCNNGFGKAVWCLKRNHIYDSTSFFFFFATSEIRRLLQDWMLVQLQLQQLMSRKASLLVGLDAGVLLWCEKPADSLGAVDLCLRASGTVAVPAIACGCASAVFLFSDVFTESCQRLNEADSF